MCWNFFLFLLFLFFYSYYFSSLFLLFLFFILIFQCNITGTKALHSTHTHLYQKAAGSLVNQVDLSRYTSDEIHQLEELEKSIIQKGSPFLLFAKGTLKLSINRANMISRFLWEWKVTSFREFVDTAGVTSSKKLIQHNDKKKFQNIKMIKLLPTESEFATSVYSDIITVTVYDN